MGNVRQGDRQTTEENVVERQKNEECQAGRSANHGKEHREEAKV